MYSTIQYTTTGTIRDSEYASESSASLPSPWVKSRIPSLDTNAQLVIGYIYVIYVVICSSVRSYSVRS
ncbi:hypothetical protein BJY00DRAFT_290464 [Aspergillus carlsbadensis]|nr:hypothetical protein BJY00DRAFT_290464 [Aspergillus carlsbadensis]